MTTIELTQSEADALFAMEKDRADDEWRDFPGLGGVLCIPLKSVDHREEFILDITRSRIKLRKNTLQNRARTLVVLVRIDLGGSPHRNPDNEEIPCPHIHYYREGFGDKWAQTLPDSFTTPDDVWNTLQEFMDYCNISKKPYIEQGIFT